MFGVSDGGLEKLRADVLQNMRREADQKIVADIKEQALEGLLEANPIEVPNSLKHQEAHAMQHEAMRRMGIEDHDKAPPQENFAEGAERRVWLSLLVPQLIEDQQIGPDRDQLRTRVRKLFSSHENCEETGAKFMFDPQIMSRFEPILLEVYAVYWIL